MSITIGLRFYKISVVERDGGSNVDFSAFDPFPFFKSFIADNSRFNDDENAQRSWALEPRVGCDLREFWGTVNYGAFGFTSKLVDKKTKKTRYNRQSTDLEQISLFYQIWIPESSGFGIASFQSFQGRSCINLIFHSIQESFKLKHNDYYLKFEKISPNYLSDTAIGKAPVKRLTLVAKKHRADPFKELTQGAGITEYNYEVSISAKRNSHFGPLAAIGKKIGSNPESILVHGSDHFVRLVAEISVNGKRRRVGLAGHDPDTGSIDVTDSVKLVDGHPTFESISEHSNEIIAEIYEKMSG